MTADRSHVTRSGTVTGKELLGISAVLVALLCAFHWNVVVGGKTLLTTYYTFKEGGPCGYTGGFEEVIDGAASSWVDIPSSYCIRNMLRTGELPLWNPYNGCGIPLAADWQTGAFCPLKWPFLPWASSVSWDLFLLGRLFLAGLFTYLFTRRIGLERLPAFTSASAYMLSGYFACWINLFHVNVDVCIPLLLLAVETNIRSSGAGCFLFGAVAAALIILGGNPQPALIAIVMSAAYLCVRLVWGELPAGAGGRCCARKALRFLAFLAAGVLLSSYAVFPFLELFAVSSHGHQNVGCIRADIRSVSTIIFPHVFPVACFWGSWRVPSVGAVTLMCASFAIRRKSRWYPLALFFSVYALMFLSKMYGAPMINRIGALPVFRSIIWFRYGATFPFATACLAGIGMNNLMCGDARRRSLVLFALCVAAVLVFTLWCRWDDFSVGDLGRWLLDGKGALMCAVILIPAVLAWSALSGRLRAVAPRAVVLFMLLELFLYTPHGRATRYELDRAPPFVRYLQKRASSGRPPFRVYGVSLLMIPQSSSVFGIQDIRTFSPLNVSWYQTVMDHVLDLRDLPPPFMSPLFATPKLDILRSAVLNLLNVKYILVVDPIPGSAASLKDRYRQVYHDRRNKVRVYENLDVMPRAFLVRTARQCGNDGEVADCLARADNRELRNMLFIRDASVGYDRPASPVMEGARRGPESAGEGEATVTQYGPRRVRITVRAVGPSYLFLSDTYYPGWKAFIDGEETAIMRANCAFRAVRVSGGEHVVEFVYRPLSLYAGTAVSAGTLLCLLGAAARRRV